jgi:hypothetical protein
MMEGQSLEVYLAVTFMPFIVIGIGYVLFRLTDKTISRFTGRSHMNKIFEKIQESSHNVILDKFRNQILKGANDDVRAGKVIDEAYCQKTLASIEGCWPGLSKVYSRAGVTLPELKTVATNALAQVGEQSPEEPKSVQRIVKVLQLVGRNQPCSCGSGKKYKKCCGK